MLIYFPCLKNRIFGKPNKIQLNVNNTSSGTVLVPTILALFLGFEAIFLKTVSMNRQEGNYKKRKRRKNQNKYSFIPI